MTQLWSEVQKLRVALVRHWLDLDKLRLDSEITPAQRGSLAEAQANIREAIGQLARLARE